MKNSRLFFIFMLSISLASMQMISCVRTVRETAAPVAVVQPPLSVEGKWGLHVESIRLTGHEYYVDLRLRVLDPEKAAAVLKGTEDAFLIDQETETRLVVPVTKVGPLRAKTELPEKDRNYVFLFSNAGKVVKAGNKVTLIIGDLTIENLTVE